jgi:hypothetical protein
MPRPKDLRSFLRKQIRSIQLKPPHDTSERSITSPSSPLTKAPNRNEDDIFRSSERQCHEIGGVFGELLPPSKGLRSGKLAMLMADTECLRSQSSALQTGDHKLLALRGELGMVVDAEQGASTRERALIARQKAALLQEITCLEHKQQAQKSPESVKGSTRSPSSHLLRLLHFGQLISH